MPRSTQLQMTEPEFEPEAWLTLKQYAYSIYGIQGLCTTPRKRIPGSRKPPEPGDPGNLLASPGWIQPADPARREPSGVYNV